MKYALPATQAFTLVELLMVLAIVALLISFSSFSYTRLRREAQDSQRKNDLRQYQAALESYANSNATSLYPSFSDNAGASAPTTLCTALAGFIANCPQDPKNRQDSSYAYTYQSNGSGGGTVNATRFILWTRLENNSGNWALCSNGTSGRTLQTDFSGNNGACPAFVN